jgi:hypothetical protein
LEETEHIEDKDKKMVEDNVAEMVEDEAEVLAEVKIKVKDLIKEAVRVLVELIMKYKKIVKTNHLMEEAKVKDVDLEKLMESAEINKKRSLASFFYYTVYILDIKT